MFVIDRADDNQLGFRVVLGKPFHRTVDYFVYMFYYLKLLRLYCLVSVDMKPGYEVAKFKRINDFPVLCHPLQYPLKVQM